MIDRILKTAKWLFAAEGDPIATALQVAMLFLLLSGLAIIVFAF